MITVVGVISREEVIRELQADAVEMHKRQVYLSNNMSDYPEDADLALTAYSSVLGTIEQQIDMLF
jgi:hypothetical protein